MENSGKKVLWTDETNINMYQIDGRSKVWRWKDSKHTTSSVKHDGDGLIAWSCMAVTGPGAFVFMDVYLFIAFLWWILRCIETFNAFKAIWWLIIPQQDNEPKHTAKATQEFLENSLIPKPI